MRDPAVKSTVQACYIRALEKKLFDDPDAQTALDLEKVLAVRNAHYYAPVLAVLEKARKALWYRCGLRAEIDEALVPFKEKEQEEKEEEQEEKEREQEEKEREQEEGAT